MIRTFKQLICICRRKQYLEYAVLRNRARINAVENYDWNVVLDEIHGIEAAKSGSEVGYTDRMHKYCEDGRFSIHAE